MQKSWLKKWIAFTLLIGFLLTGCSFETAEELVQLAEEKSLLLENEANYEKRVETYGGNAFSGIDRQVLLEARETYKQALAEITIVNEQKESARLQARLGQVKNSLDKAESYERLIQEASSMDNSIEEMIKLIRENESEMALISIMDEFKQEVVHITMLSESLGGTLKDDFIKLYVEPAKITLSEAQDSIKGVSDY